MRHRAGHVELDLGVGRAARARLEGEAGAAGAARRGDQATRAVDGEHPPGLGERDREAAVRDVDAPVGRRARLGRALDRIVAAAAAASGTGRRSPGRDRRHRDAGHRLARAGGHEVALAAVEQVAPERGRLHPERLGRADAGGRGGVAPVGGLGHEAAGRHRLEPVAAAGERVAGAVALRVRPPPPTRPRPPGADHEQEATGPSHGGDATCRGAPMRQVQADCQRSRERTSRSAAASPASASAAEIRRISLSPEAKAAS